jgi:uncharacterized protein YjbI with pentapeptide repeats
MIRFWSSLAAIFLVVLALISAVRAEPADFLKDVASIKAGNHDCPHCVLAGADLSNQCVKQGNLEGADFDHARAVLMCMSFADFRGATFRGTDLSGANLAHADVDGADFTGANFTITSIKGTDLRKVKGLTQQQLDEACGDADTKAPAGLTVRLCD